MDTQNRLLFILFAFILFSCQGNRDIHNLLDRIEMFVETDADSARILLDSIPMPDTMNDKLFARWCMLEAKIADKLNEDMPYVEQLTRASNWYAKNGTKEQQAWIGLYLGRSYVEDKLFIPATNAYLDALEIALEDQKYNVAGYISSYMGDLYFYTGQTAEEQRKYEEAANYFKKAGNTRSYAFALRDIAKALTFKDSCSLALEYMLTADSIITKLNNPREMSELANNLGNVYELLDESEKAKQYYLKAMEIDTLESVSNYLTLSSLYYSDDMLDSARYYLSKTGIPTLNPYTSIDKFYMGYLIEKEAKDFTKALLYLEQYIGKKDSLYNEEMQVDIVDAEKRHHLSMLLKKNRDLNNAKYFYIILFSLSVIVGLSIYLIYLKRDKNRIKEINDQQAELDQKEVRLKELEKEIHVKNTRLEDTSSLLQEFEKTKQDLNALKSAKFNAEMIVKRLKRQCKKVTPDKKQEVASKDWNSLIALINTYYPNVATFIENNSYNLTEKETEMCYLSFLQLDVKEESILLDINPESVSKRRLRTRQKLNLTNLEKSIYEFLVTC